MPDNKINNEFLVINLAMVENHGFSILVHCQTITIAEKPVLYSQLK